MMKKKVMTLAAASIAAVTLLAVCGGSTEQSAGGAKGDKTLIVGTEPTFPPFEFTENDKDVGFDIDLAQAICDKLGYKMEVKNLGFDALIPALKSGQIDIIAAGMDATEERKKQINFTDVYYQGGYTIVVPVGNTDITGYDSIAGKTVGAQVGSKAADCLSETENPHRSHNHLFQSIKAFYNNGPEAALPKKRPFRYHILNMPVNSLPDLHKKALP